MPWKLVPPREGKTPFWYVRGKYLGIALDRSTGASEKRAATTIFNTWKRKIERGEVLQPTETTDSGLFLSAAKAYMISGGERQYVEAICLKWPTKVLADIDQVAIDTLAAELYPDSPASTRNRQVYTPVSAILKHVGIDKTIKRPKGWRGNKRTFWLQPESTFRLLEAAAAIDAEFGILCTLLNYTGLRISEALDELTCEGIEIAREFAYIGDTKTEEPRGVYLPPVVVAALANHPRGLARRGRLFRYHDGGRLRDMLKAACKRADIVLPRRTAFHVFRHNYGTWMRLYGGVDDLGLTRTGVWLDRASVARYAHSETTTEARQAIKLPTPKRGDVVEIKDKVG